MNRSAETLVGSVHGLTVNQYAVNTNSAPFDMANWQEAVLAFNMLSVLVAASTILIQHSDDSDTWETIGTVTLATGIYNTTPLARVHRDDVKRYVRARFVPGSGATIVGGCNILGLIPKAANTLPPTFSFDSRNI